jgi:hypothetical protein
MHYVPILYVKEIYDRNIHINAIVSVFILLIKWEAKTCRERNFKNSACYRKRDFSDDATFVLRAMISLRILDLLTV